MATVISNKLYDLSASLDKHLLRCDGLSAAFIGMGQFSVSAGDPTFQGVDLFVQEVVDEARALIKMCDEVRAALKQETPEPTVENKPLLLLRDIIPEWREEGAYERDRFKAYDYMDERGFTDKEIATLVCSDPRITAMAVDGWRWRDSLAKARTVNIETACYAGA
jgi:hypothetical protein